MSGTNRREHDAIQGLVTGVRRRWRLRLALRGLAWTVGLTLAVALLSSLALERLRFAAEAVTWFRVLTWGTLLGSVAAFLVRPLLRRVTDQQVALYLEEHEPSLDHTVVSALHASGRPDLSPALSRRLSEMAMERARRVDFGKRVEQTALYRMGGALTALTVATLALTLTGPEHLRHGLSALLLPTTDAAAVNPYSIAVEPGDVTIARGSDQMVSASLGGFQATEASLFTRTGPDASFQRLSMLPGEDGGFEILLLGVGERTEYFVESTGVRSPTYTVEVADLPYVGQLDLVYRFPAYTGLPPRTVEDGGDVAALPGTEVEVRIVPTLPAPAGRLVLDGEPMTELEVEQGGTLVGRFTVRDAGFYAVELARSTGELVPASPEYTIDVLSDQEPSVHFSTPGRDETASPIEEVYVEVAADDDYGVGDVRLVWSVNGGPEDTVPIFQGHGDPLPEVSAGHTLFLEEWMLEPGDLVSYYALVRDNRTVEGGEPVVSDMFFLTVRPFERAYREGEQQGGGPPQGGGPQPESALSELQRQIISATFNLIRQEDSYDPHEFSENVVSVALTQTRLKDQVQNLLVRMQNRGLTETDPGFRDVSAILPLASEAMDTARAFLDDEALQDAIPHEQSALRYLQQAEETYERYVTQQQNQAGGGGGGQQAAEDLADLFELELDKLQNQYETVRREEQQSADQEVDEVLEELKELARRQEQEMERQRRRAQAGQQGGQGAGDNLRELADDAEEAARHLQRLARETNDRELEETARNLQQAAEDMRRSASRQGQDGVARAEAARRRLEEARRRLEDSRAARTERNAEAAIRQVEELTRQQREVQRQVRELPDGPEARRGAIERLRERKDQMTEAVRDLERELDDAAATARADHPEAARDLKEAADQIRESKLKEKLQYSKGTIEQWDAASANTLEVNIEGDLRELREQLERARQSSGERQADPLREALEDTRDLVRGVESMDRRLRDSAGGREDRPGQEGHEGEAGPEGQEGAQGQEGRQGEAGEQGREGPQGRAGQAGQEGGQPGDPGEDPSRARGQPGPPSGGATRGDPRALTPEEIRQFSREFGQRGERMRAVRDRLREAGRPVEELQAVLDAMGRLEREGIWDNPAQVAGLNEEILEMLKRLEFGLRREVEGESERRATLTGSDEVPPGYRKLVEEYYKALARGGG